MQAVHDGTLDVTQWLVEALRGSMAPMTSPYDAQTSSLQRAAGKKENEMTKELGVWTAEDCALVLIDYQKEMFEVIRSETNADLVELNVRLLAKTAKAFDMPIVLSTVGVGYGFNGPTVPAVLSELDGHRADRSLLHERVRGPGLS